MKKRLLFIPLHYNVTPRPHEDWFNALSDEFDCVYIGDENDRIENKYDYIFMQSGAIHPDTLRTFKGFSNAKIIQWTGDAREDIMENVLQYKGIVDLTLLAVGIGQKEMYENALGSPVGYLQQGVFESFFMEPKELTEGKIVFIGNNYDQFEGARERAELCRMLSCANSDFEVIGNGFPRWEIQGEYASPIFNNHRSIPYEESAKIYNESYISISHACFNDIEGYYSNRTLDIMAAGGCCLMRYVPGAEKFFTHGVNVLFYKNASDCEFMISILELFPSMRNEIARNGHELAKREHTFKHRALEIKLLIEIYL